MIGFSTKRYFGIDIGDSSIKLVEARKTREGFRISNARIVELGVDPTFDDRERKKSIIREKLKQLFAEEGISSGTVALSISGQSVFIRPLKVPKIAKNKIEQIIRYEAQLQVPFPMNEVIWSYELFEEYDSAEAEVALVAVKRDIIDERIKLVQGFGLDIEFIEVDPFSLFNALDFVSGIKNKIILDIGSSATDIIIVEENKIWTRSILIGGNDLTKAVAASFNISFKEAEELKKKEGITILHDNERDSSPKAVQISDAITPILVDLQTDISKSIGYYKSQSDKTKVLREVLIMGGCSKLKNISEFIGGNIDIPAKPFDLLEKIKADLDFEVTEDITRRLGVGIGLAFRTVTPLFTKTNLIPKEIQKAKEFENKKWFIVGSLSVAIMIFATLSSFVNWSNKAEETALFSAQFMIERYTDLHMEIAQRQGQIKDIKRRMGSIVEISEKRKKLIETFTELTAALPDDVWLTEIRHENNTLIIGGRVKESFENISVFKDALARSKYFGSIRVESANVVQEGRVHDKGVTEDIRAFIIRISI
ncbi:MAG: type IV pilus assembly protein PilM [Candidatus Omnitrophica bacterium]|nr:type IV pilus assembly protein PilM [Candidatus Omnitrophota bacterium]